MKKLNDYVCDNPKCRKVCTDNHITIQGKKRKLHYCNELCIPKKIILYTKPTKR